MKTQTKEMQDKMTPAQALALLKDGNQRFVDNLSADRDLLAQASETTDGQFPFAVVLSCIDSRTSSELIFDQGIGDIFSVRIAGNIVNDDILGSMEFACKLAGSKVIAVIGHSKCGAVKGACDNAELGNLTTLLSKIAPAIEDEKTVTENRDSSNADFVQKVTLKNVKRAMNEIKERSPVLREMVDNDEIMLVGGYHDLDGGKVSFDI